VVITSQGLICKCLLSSICAIGILPRRKSANVDDSQQSGRQGLQAGSALNMHDASARYRVGPRPGTVGQL
jgi:hypothetical protein